jgi:hypothetical protein
MKFFLRIVFIIPIFLFAFNVYAQNPFNVQFPIPELGNCSSLGECKSYCDDPSNASECILWAEANGFKAEKPKPHIEKILEEDTGPGGCEGRRECREYCDVSDNKNECFEFAKKNNLIQQDEIKRIERNINREPKEGPGGCSSRSECDTFCRVPENAPVCVQFAVDEGKISQEEADFLIKRAPRMDELDRRHDRPDPRDDRGPKIDEKRVSELILEKGGPSGCSTFEECDAFCSNPTNGEVCMNYAIENGLMSSEEAEKAKKFMNEEGPGGCRGIECKVYCEDPENQQECFQFAVDNKLMDPKEAEDGRKFMEVINAGGPGGCKGPRECDIYCSVPEHGQECFEFASKHGLVSNQEIKHFEREKEIMKKLEGQGGPGGCREERECREYCQDSENFDECAAFSVEAGVIQKEEARNILQDFVSVENGSFIDPGDFRPPGFENFGPPDNFKEKFEERFKKFEQHKEGFEKRNDFCLRPENFEECKKIGPPPFFPSNENDNDAFDSDFNPSKRPLFDSKQSGNRDPRFIGPPEEFPGEKREFPGRDEFSPYENFPHKEDRSFSDNKEGLEKRGIEFRDNRREDNDFKEGKFRPETERRFDEERSEDPNRNIPPFDGEFKSNEDFEQPDHRKDLGRPDALRPPEGVMPRFDGSGDDRQQRFVPPSFDGGDNGFRQQEGFRPSERRSPFDDNRNREKGLSPPNFNGEENDFRPSEDFRDGAPQDGGFAPSSIPSLNFPHEEPQSKNLNVFLANPLEILLKFFR